MESSWLKVRLAPLAAPVSLNPLAKGLWSIFSCATCQRAKKYGKIEPYFCTLKNLIISKSPLIFQRILFYWKIEKLHFWKILDCKLLSHLWQKDCCQFSALWPIKQKENLYCCTKKIIEFCTQFYRIFLHPILHHKKWYTLIYTIYKNDEHPIILFENCCTLFCTLFIGLLLLLI